MNKYQQTPSRIIDLHGKIIPETKVILEEILFKYKNNNKNSNKTKIHIRIITGKGLHSANGVATIKTFVKKFLTENQVSFRQSKIQEGGEGSLEVFF